MVLGHELSQRAHAGDSLFCDGLDALPEINLAGPCKARALAGDVLGPPGWHFETGVGSALANRRAVRRLHWNADRRCSKTFTIPPTPQPCLTVRVNLKLG